MKKVILILGVAGLFTFSSCSKCGTCSDQSVVFSGEYCKGNAIEDALYESAKVECEALGGSFE
ncbi:MAG: hypothetical protein ISR01_01140 [Chitinophagales bacterium]|nr:hypothetical protein [Chitinophagales bacterium]